MRGSSNAQADLSSKQDTLTFDTVPTANSTNPITSGGVYTALQDIEPAPSYSLSGPVLIQGTSSSAATTGLYNNSYYLKYTFSNLYRNGKNITGKVSSSSVSSEEEYLPIVRGSPTFTFDLSSIIGTHTGNISMGYIVYNPNKSLYTGLEGIFTGTVTNGVISITNPPILFNSVMASLSNSTAIYIAIYSLTVS